jgi:hypothetical protein
LKRPRILLGSAVTLALVLALVMAVPVYAADVNVAKGVTPPDPNVYNLTDTIHYTILIMNTSGSENVVIEVVSDTLPDGSTGVVNGPALPYTIPHGQNVTYTCDWVATRTGTVINNCVVSGFQVSTFNDTFVRYGQKSSTVLGREVGGTASLVNKVRLVAPWAALLGCAAVVTLLVLRKRRQA